ncbi:MAG: hypothetical protein KDC52_01990 [Ignavibacteriae bacterium]|nr:hypothetical protein [Ignavibacteriota bacterium]MCB0821365.1 hypothetical protein [Bacteroidales bacterium]
MVKQISEYIDFFIVLFDRLKLVIIHTERALSGLPNSNFNWPKFREGYRVKDQGLVVLLWEVSSFGAPAGFQVAQPPYGQVGI